jgi:uncharacterized membrane protein
MRFNPYILFVFAAVILGAISQILLKKGAQQAHGSMLREYLNPWVLGGYALLVIATLLNVVAFSGGIELKSAAVLETFGFVLVMLLCKVLFHEKITQHKLIGNAMIVLGILVFYL